MKVSSGSWEVSHCTTSYGYIGREHGHCTDSTEIWFQCTSAYRIPMGLKVRKKYFYEETEVKRSMYVCRDEHVCTHMPCVLFLKSGSLVLWISVSLRVGACGWGGVGQWELGTLLSPSLQLWGHNHILPHPVFDVGAGHWTQVLLISWQAVSNWDIPLGLRPDSLNDLLDIVWQSDDIQDIRSWAYPIRKISQMLGFKASVACVYSCWFQNWISGLWASLLHQLPSVTVTNTWEK